MQASFWCEKNVSISPSNWSGEKSVFDAFITWWYCVYCSVGLPRLKSAWTLQEEFYRNRPNQTKPLSMSPACSRRQSLYITLHWLPDKPSDRPALTLYPCKPAQRWPVTTIHRYRMQLSLWLSCCCSCWRHWWRRTNGWLHVDTDKWRVHNGWWRNRPTTGRTPGRTTRWVE